MTKATTDNMRFCKMAAVTPQKRQCELESYYPAGSSVKPPPRKAAGALGVMRRKRSGKSSRFEKKVELKRIMS